MKASTIGVVSAAILMVVAGVGFGIAQAGGTHTDPSGSSIEDREIPQGEKSQADGMLLSSGGQEFVPEDNWSGTDWQAAWGPIETGAIPGMGSEESWMKDYGND
jgi:hypothetical protein